eukprot:4464589-Alexandrium_andersonii.AAC.1
MGNSLSIRKCNCNRNFLAVLSLTLALVAWQLGGVDVGVGAPSQGIATAAAATATSMSYCSAQELRWPSSVQAPLGADHECFLCHC